MVLSHSVFLATEPLMTSPYLLSEDLSLGAQIGVGLLVLASVVLLFVETTRRTNGRVWVFITGVLAVLGLALAVLRPAKIKTKGKEVAGYALALLDSSHRLNLQVEPGRTRRQVALGASETLAESFENARLEVKEFGAGIVGDEAERGTETTSDLLAALRQVTAQQNERPRSIVLLSDGRLTRPTRQDGKEWAETLKTAAGGIPIHTVALTDEVPNDRSIRALGLTGTAVAHQPLNLKITVGCEPHPDCDEVEVVVRELLEGQEPHELSRGTAQGRDGQAELELELTLERAGGRVIEIELLSDSPDAIPENDRRILPVVVRRDRLRMLHVAGRPTYDVRALRMFLKSDESIDLISFFILRTQSDEVGATQDELSLIPFPVDELFTEHLRSFDAVILQDIDAPRYRLDRHFRSIKNYVLKGGGLILVGGPTGFSSGGYAGSPIEDVLPVRLPTSGELVTRQPFVPAYTAAGRAAPMLRNLQLTMGENLPLMSGANILGQAREGALVLWQHPELGENGVSGGDLMPILSLGEVGDGRTIAISVDSTHQMRFGETGAKTGGRGYADLWEGLLGWLMRDPRYESAQLHLEHECIAGRDLTLRVEKLPHLDQEVTVELERLGTVASDVRQLERIGGGEGTRGLRYLARQLEAGGYAARVRVGAAPPTRAVFACEVGGQPWSDSRPDLSRLEAIAKATGGQFVSASTIRDLPEPPSVFVSAQRQIRAILPAWLWALVAVGLMSTHWIVRRAVGHV